MKRDASGKFAAGNPGGPGRPKKPPASPPPPRAPKLGDADELLLAAMALRDLEAAWHRIELRWPRETVLALARDALARGNPLPARIATLLTAGET
jgi:hypothetical protein